ncbi:MAG TPA: ferrous iron transport protein B [Kofleriaceae bacterium]|nr:ferrous iron transport protein B [Kofleriaceae bacterium]
MTTPGRRVALCGNPNTGKTSIFNLLTGAQGRVGNYPGVTVDRRVAVLRGRPDVEVIDVPGTYSLVARSADERIALDVIAGLGGERLPELLVVCVDATQLVRSLYLLLQVQELGRPCVVALTMTDEAGKAGADPGRLAQVLGCPVVPVVGRTGKGVDVLRLAIEQGLKVPPPAAPWRWTPSEELAARLDLVEQALPAGWPRSRGLALWALMSLGDDELSGIPDELRTAVARALGPDHAARAAAGASVDDEAVLGRYRWLDRTIAPLHGSGDHRRLTDRIDRVLLHRPGGLVVFAGIMFVLFMSLFTWAQPAIDLIDHGFGWLGTEVKHVLPPGVIADFLADGVIAGVGSVLVFLPQILLLFFFLGLLEDLGYLARVAYLMDRIMRSMNLHGRAFVPMLSGFACAVPAIMATRTMERQRDRTLTMLVIPLMTCSARLPVYTLVIAAMFPAGNLAGISTKSLLMVAMYAFSVLTALAAAWILGRTVKPLKAKRLPFVIELPPYRVPRARDLLRMMWSKTRVFLTEAGTVILACTIALWALLYFPRALPADAPDYRTQIAAASAAGDGERVHRLEAERDGALLEHSYGARLGKAIEPAIAPLGFDWKIGVGIVGAFAAREVFVATMGVIHGVGDDETSLRDKLRRERDAHGHPRYTPLVGLSLMVFFALACQCMSTLAVVKRETGGYRWPLFMLGYMTVLAWTVSFLVFQLGRLLGF